MYATMTLVAFGGLMVTAQLTPIARSYGMDQTILWFGVSAMGFALVLDRIVNGLTRPFWGWIEATGSWMPVFLLAAGFDLLAAAAAFF